MQNNLILNNKDETVNLAAKTKCSLCTNYKRVPCLQDCQNKYFSKF